MYEFTPIWKSKDSRHIIARGCDEHPGVVLIEDGEVAMIISKGNPGYRVIKAFMDQMIERCLGDTVTKVDCCSGGDDAVDRDNSRSLQAWVWGI